MKRETFVLVARVVAAVFVSGIGFGVAGWAAAGADPNEAAAWVEATATTIALVGATVAAVFAIAAFGLETRRENRFIETQRRAQASVVAAWPDTKSENLFPTGSDSIRRRLGKVTFHGFQLRNASDVPVTGVEVKAVCGGEDLGTQYVGLLPPGTEPVFVSWDPEIDTKLTALRDAAKKAGEDPNDFTPVVAISFVDAASVMWTRDQYGELVEGWFPDQ